jgi:hypothetical protein
VLELILGEFDVALALAGIPRASAIDSTSVEMRSSG